MATVIDALVIELGLDPSKFTKGQKEATAGFAKTKDAAVTTGKAIEQASKKAADSISVLAAEVTALAAVFLGFKGLKEFVGDIISADAALGRFANNLGTSPQAISTWGLAIERLGGNASDAQRTFERLGKSLNDFRFNGKGLPDEFFQLQALAHQRINTNQGVPKFLQDTAAALKNVYQANPSRAHFMAEALGIDDASANLMFKYGAAVTNVAGALKNLAPTNQEIAAAQSLQSSWVELMQTAENFGNTLVRDLEPAISPILKQFADWIEVNHDLIATDIKSWVGDFVGWVKDPATAQGFHHIVDDAERLLGIVDRLAQGKGIFGSLFGGGTVQANPPKITDSQGRNASPDPNAGANHPFFSGNKLFEGSSHYDGTRAGGGPVSAGKRYLVGEKGPEVVSFGSNGRVTPNDGLGTMVDGKPVNKSNPMPVTITDSNANAGSGGSWWDSVKSFLGLDGSGGGGGGRKSGRGAGDPASAARATAPISGDQLKGTSAELVNYIKELAIRHGIDPNIALRVARSEGGLLNPYRHGEAAAPHSQLASLGSKENSYGPFQLYISGTGAGLGDRALKAGIDPRKNWKAGIDFALDEVRRKGWGQWYGAQHQGIHGKMGVGPLPGKQSSLYYGHPGLASLWPAMGARMAALSTIQNTHNVTTSSSSNEQHIGAVHIHTQATDAPGIARSIKVALSNTTGAVNTGPV